MIAPDEVLVETYKKVGITADRIALEAESRDAFMARLPSGCDPEDVAKRLVNLRRRGKLPRLHRVLTANHA